MGKLPTTQPRGSTEEGEGLTHWKAHLLDTYFLHTDTSQFNHLSTGCEDCWRGQSLHYLTIPAKSSKIHSRVCFINLLDSSQSNLVDKVNHWAFSTCRKGTTWEKGGSRGRELGGNRNAGVWVRAKPTMHLYENVIMESIILFTMNIPM